MFIPFRNSLISQIADNEAKITVQEGGTPPAQAPGTIVLAPHTAPNEAECRKQVNRFWNLVLTRSSLGFGEAYMEGLWTTPDLTDLIYHILKANLHKRIPWNPFLAAGNLRETLLAPISLTTKEKTRKGVQNHYDQEHDVVEAMLGDYQVYSCGFWKNANSVDEAQKDKIDLIARKLKLDQYPEGYTPRVLDIGCGYGDALRYMAQTYGIKGVGLTLSEEQAQRAREKVAGLDIEIRVADYRDLSSTSEGQFDGVYSIGMFEHVGRDQHPIYCKKVAELLKPDGLSVLHTITSRDASINYEPWFMHYIFPHTYVPSDLEVTQALDTSEFHKKHTEFFGQDYARTLDAWYQRFVEKWDGELRHRFESDQDARTFYRMWEFYLRAAQAGFIAGKLDLAQYVLSKNENLEYDAPTL